MGGSSYEGGSRVNILHNEGNPFYSTKNLQRKAWGGGGGGWCVRTPPPPPPPSAPVDDLTLVHACLAIQHVGIELFMEFEILQIEG